MENYNHSNEIHTDSKEHRINYTKDTLQKLPLNPSKRTKKWKKSENLKMTVTETRAPPPHRSC